MSARRRGASREVGAGTGRSTLPALERGWRIAATDFNESLPEELRAKFAERDPSTRRDVRVEDVFALAAKRG